MRWHQRKLNDDVAGFYWWFVTRVQSEVPQCSIASPTDGQTVVDADDGTNGFQFVPTVNVTGDATAFGFGTTSVTVEIERVVRPIQSSEGAARPWRLPNRGPSQSMDCPTDGQSYTLVASCDGPCGKRRFNGRCRCKCLYSSDQLDFPVSVPTSIEGRYQTANLPASVTLTKSPDAVISECTVAVNAGTPSPFVWPSRQCSGLGVTRSFEGADALHLDKRSLPLSVTRVVSRASLSIAISLLITRPL